MGSMAVGAPTGREEYRKGIRHLRGDGVEKSYSRAASWIRKGADAGYLPAQYALAKLYLKGLGVKKSEKMAVHLLRKAHSTGYAKATAELQKLGFPAEAPTIPATAPATHRPPIILPVKPDSQVIQEMMVHLKILSEVLNEPFLFRTKLNADRGSPFHQFHLGYLHEIGHLVKKDRKSARAWYAKAASGGYPPAKAFLKRLERMREQKGK